MKKTARNAEPNSKENQNTARNAEQENSTTKPEPGQIVGRLGEEAPDLPAGQPIGGAPAPTFDLAHLADIVAENQQKINAIFQYLSQPQQEGPPGAASGTQQPNPALLQMLMSLMSGSHSEDPFITAMKQKAIMGMDLSNAMMTALIKRIAEGKPI